MRVDVRDSGMTLLPQAISSVGWRYICICLYSRDYLHILIIKRKYGHEKVRTMRGGKDQSARPGGDSRCNGTALRTARPVAGPRIGRWCEQGHAGQFPAASQRPSAMAVSGEAVIADAVKPVRQHMDQEAADELPAVQGHRLLESVEQPRR
jgi:hypothetical protein